MKIVILVSYLDLIGGTEKQSYNLAKNLSKNHDVLILTRKHRALPAEEEKDGFKIIRFRYINFPILRFFSHIASALLKIKGRDIDLLQCMMLTPNGLVGIIAKKIYGIKTIAWIRGSDWNLAKNRPLTKFIISMVIKNSDLILAQTHKTKNEVLRKFPDVKIEVVPNGIEKVRRIKLPRDIGILFVGRLTKVKGPKYFLEAMKSLHKIRGVIIGDGPERKILEKSSIGLDVEFLGSLSREKVIEYMFRSKILVLPSLTEGFPSVILEAMSCGLPVVATSVGGVPEIVENRRTGFLVEPRDVEELVKHIRLLLDDEELRNYMSENCLREVEKYSWDSVIARLEETYKKIP